MKQNFTVPQGTLDGVETFLIVAQHRSDFHCRDAVQVVLERRFTSGTLFCSFPILSCLCLREVS